MVGPCTSVGSIMQYCFFFLAPFSSLTIGAVLLVLHDSYVILFSVHGVLISLSKFLNLIIANHHLTRSFMKTRFCLFAQQMLLIQYLIHCWIEWRSFQ
jgi:hypothetical protein